MLVLEDHASSDAKRWPDAPAANRAGDRRLHGCTISTTRPALLCDCSFPTPPLGLGLPTSLLLLLLSAAFELPTPFLNLRTMSAKPADSFASSLGFGLSSTKLSLSSPTSLLALAVVVLFLINRIWKNTQTATRTRKTKDGRELAEPPMIPYSVPFLGSMITFGMRPLEFLRENLDKVST